MKDKVKHKFCKIFLKYLKEVEGVELFYMTPQEAEDLNNKKVQHNHNKENFNQFNGQNHYENKKG